jgi:hypothetical protein
MTQAEIVKPAERDPARWATARCNDGTSFDFQVRLSATGQTTKWILFLDGGGFCEDFSRSCASRPSSLTSTVANSDRSFTQMKNQGIFNPNKTKNPTFYDANFAYGHYCSSDVWSGATTQRRPTTGSPVGWYFSGQANVRSMFEILIERYGLDDANPQTRVLFAGTSAGGVGVEVNADAVAKLLPQTASAGHLKLINDAGVFVDFDDPNHRPGEPIPLNVPIRDVMAQAYNFWAASHNPFCEKAQRQQTLPLGRCYFTGVNYPYITQPSPNGSGLPLLIQSSSIDEPSITFHHINPGDTADAPGLAKWRTTALQSFSGLAWLFSGGHKAYHTLLPRDDSSTGWNMGPPNQTFRQVVTRFWEGGSPVRVIFGNP